MLTYSPQERKAIVSTAGTAVHKLERRASCSAPCSMYLHYQGFGDALNAHLTFPSFNTNIYFTQTVSTTIKKTTKTALRWTAYRCSALKHFDTASRHLLPTPTKNLK